MLQIPPYARALYALQKSGKQPTNTVIVWMGAFAWKKGQAFINSNPTRTLVLPPWENPRNYYWPVNKCDVLIYNTSPCDIEYVEDLVYELYKCGADIVRYESPFYVLTVYRNLPHSSSLTKEC